MAIEELSALAATSAATLVGAMVSDAWESAKNAFSALLGQGDQGRSQVIERRLEESHLFLASHTGSERDRAILQQQAAWQARIIDLLDENPSLATSLHDIVCDLGQQTSQSSGDVSQNFTAFNQANQAVQGHGQQTNNFGVRSGSEEA